MNSEEMKELTTDLADELGPKLRSLLESSAKTDAEQALALYVMGSFATYFAASVFGEELAREYVIAWATAIPDAVQHSKEWKKDRVQ